MKRIIAMLLMLVILLSLCACGGKQLEVPDVYNVDEQSAKSALSALGLIPAVAYDYDDTVGEGFVCYTSPSIGTTVEQGERITVYVSKGPKRIRAKDAYMQWRYKDFDDVEFKAPYIYDRQLYIECRSDTPARDISWYDSHNNGSGYGLASLNDSFDKTVPLKIRYDQQYASVKAGEHIEFTIVVPLAELDDDRPTSIYMKLSTGKDTTDVVELIISMTW